MLSAQIPAPEANAIAAAAASHAPIAGFRVADGGREAPGHVRRELLEPNLDLAALDRVALLTRELEPLLPQAELLEETLALGLLELEVLEALRVIVDRVIEVLRRRRQTIGAWRAASENRQRERECGCTERPGAHGEA